MQTHRGKIDVTTSLKGGNENCLFLARKPNARLCSSIVRMLETGSSARGKQSECECVVAIVEGLQLAVTFSGMHASLSTSFCHVAVCSFDLRRIHSSRWVCVSTTKSRVRIWTCAYLYDVTFVWFCYFNCYPSTTSGKTEFGVILSRSVKPEKLANAFLQNFGSVPTVPPARKPKKQCSSKERKQLSCEYDRNCWTNYV